MYIYIYMYMHVYMYMYMYIFTYMYISACPSACSRLGTSSSLLFCYSASRAEGRIWETRFGFRSNRGTSDALFMARRLLEDAWASHDGGLVLLGLGWAKAFDSISPEALLAALTRFGLPSKFVGVVRASTPTGRLLCRMLAQPQVASGSALASVRRVRSRHSSLQC